MTPTFLPSALSSASTWRNPSHRLRLGLRVCACLLAGMFGAPDIAEAGGVRGELRSTASWAQTRTYTREVVPEDQTIGTGLVRHLEDGTVVICVPGGECYWYRSAGTESSTPVSQDLRLTAWGLTRGLSGRLHVRGRYGSDDFWPRSQEEFEVVSGYLEWERQAYRVRGGRQFRQTGLGFYEFDGLDALWRARPWISVEAYGGRSLARGLSQPLTGFLLEEADEFAPNEPGFLIGAQLRVHPLARWRGALVYQREIREDRAALYSERISANLDGRAGRVRLDGAIDLDLATERLNEARLQARAPVHPNLDLTARGVYRRPYFDLWTIWEAFTPVGYEEAGLRMTWHHRRAQLYAESSIRRYDDTHLEVAAFPVRDDGFEVAAGGSVSFRDWEVSGGYGAEVGFGAAEDHFDASVRRLLPIGYLGLQGFATQQTREFRNGEDWIVGGGLLAGLEWGDFDLTGTIGWHRLSYRNRADYPDWNQKRARLSVGYRFGGDPGQTRAGRRTTADADTKTGDADSKTGDADIETGEETL